MNTKGAIDGSDERRTVFGACIFKKEKIPSPIPNKRIQITIAINIGKRWDGKNSYIGQPKWVGTGRRKYWIGNVSCISKKQRVTVIISYKSIQITIAININKNWGYIIKIRSNYYISIFIQTFRPTPLNTKRVIDSTIERCTVFGACIFKK